MWESLAIQGSEQFYIILLFTSYFAGPSGPRGDRDKRKAQLQDMLPMTLLINLEFDNKWESYYEWGAHDEGRAQLQDIFPMTLHISFWSR